MLTIEEKVKASQEGEYDLTPEEVMEAMRVGLIDGVSDLQVYRELLEEGERLVEYAEVDGEFFYRLVRDSNGV